METGAHRELSGERSVEQARKNNVLFVYGIDQQLRRGIGLSLKELQPRGVTGKLPEGEKRALGKPENSGEPRSIIIDASGEQRFERHRNVVDGHVLPETTWHTCLDQGSVGWVGMKYLELSLQLRVTCVADPLHRMVNDYLGALRRCGHQRLRLQML
eukprot:3695243-Amphidinium_carterae.1